MNKLPFLLLAFIFWSARTFSQEPSTKVVASIQSVLASQSAAWNEGDLDRFMVGYWESEELVFVGKSGPKFGWKTTLDNYKKGYPDKSSMGQLTFNLLNFRALGNKHVLVIGQWILKREEEKGDLEGYFSLVWRKIRGEWVIIADHSS